jgi:hypothetical protein
MKNENKILMIVLIVALVLLLFGGFGMMSFSGGMMGGDYYGGFGMLIGIIAIVCAILVIYDVINNKRLSDSMKILWIIFAIIFSIITAVIYYLVGRDKKSDLFRRTK